MLVCILKLVLVAALAGAAEMGAAEAGSTPRSQAGSLRRDLLAICPIAYCSTAKTACPRSKSKYKCNKCTAPRVTNAAQSACVCPAGSFPTSKRGGCSPCPANFFCKKGSVADKSTAAPCPPNMVTLNTGAKSLLDCVVAPGFRYDEPDSRTVRALACGDDTWSGGLDKSTACKKCPNGLRTDPSAAAGSLTSVAACTAPPGFFRLGDFPLPCPQGAYKEDYSDDDTCKSCADLYPFISLQSEQQVLGITTGRLAATSASECVYTLPGFILVDENGAAITELLNESGSLVKVGGARVCPNNYVCPGGSPFDPASIPHRCPDGLFTLKPGAKTDQACVAPPGMYSPGPGQPAKHCPSGTYKMTWELIGIEGCLSCGTGGLWMSDPMTYIDEYDPVTGTKSRTVLTRGTPNGCYIQPGMGSISVGVFTPPPAAGGGEDLDGDGYPDYYNNDYGGELPLLQALFCPQGFYGRSNKNQGLFAQPCAACPVGMNTFADSTTGVDGSSSTRASTYLALSAADGSEVELPVPAGSGFLSPEACLTLPGIGFYTGGTAQACSKGWYNPGRNRDPCTRCPPNWTTKATKSTSIQDCSVAEVPADNG